MCGIVYSSFFKSPEFISTLAWSPTTNILQKRIIYINILNTKFVFYLSFHFKRRFRCDNLFVTKVVLVIKLLSCFLFGIFGIILFSSLESLESFCCLSFF
eukprot:UN15906